MFNLDILKLNKRKLLIGIFILVVCGYLNMISIQSQQGLYVNSVNVPKMTCFEYFLNIQGDAVGFLHIVYFLAITLVIGDIFIKEKKSSMIYFSLVRSDVNRYIKQKIIDIGFMGIVFMFLSQVMLLIISMILYPIASPSLSQEYVLYIGKEFFSNHPFLYCFIVIFNSCIMTFAYCCFTVFISVIFNNIYVVLTLPYLFNIGISIFMTGFPLYIGNAGKVIYSLAPTILAGAYISNSVNFILPILYWTVLSIVFYFLSVVSFKSKFENENVI